MGATIKHLQDKLNMANKTVAELMEQNAKIKNDLVFAQELAHVRLHEITCKASSLKTVLAENHALKTDYALLENSYTEVNKDYKDLLDKFTEISAENYALKAEIERTNRHINLAENVINAKEQQPLVVNHYHNCTINK